VAARMAAAIVAGSLFIVSSLSGLADSMIRDTALTMTDEVQSSVSTR
jgi:hypothetical protein